MVVGCGKVSIVISQIRGEWGSKSFTCERRLGDTKNPTPWCFELGRPDIRISHPFLTKVCEDSTFVSCAHSKEILWLKQKRRMLSYLVISLSPSTFQKKTEMRGEGNSEWFIDGPRMVDRMDSRLFTGLLNILIVAFYVSRFRVDRG